MGDDNRLTTKKAIIKPNSARTTKPPAIPPTTAPVLSDPDTAEAVLVALILGSTPASVVVGVAEWKTLVFKDGEV